MDAELESSLERRRFRDQHPVFSSSVASLSRLIFEEEYLPHAFAPEVLAADERSYEERLAACRMIAMTEPPVPTVLALLVLAKSPRDWLPSAYIQFLRIAGTEWSDPVSDEAVLDGALSQMLRRLDEKLESHNRTSLDIVTQPTEARVFFYPRGALQQLSRNAVMHRTYKNTHAPTRVYWFDDRIEIRSPGGPYGTVTAENFGLPGIADYRNPHVAEAMKVLGLVQRFGVGIATARAELLANGNPPPEFQVDAGSVLAVVRKRP